MMKVASALAFAGVTSARPHKNIEDIVPVAPTPVINDCNNTCLELQLTDFYGDGWDGVMVYAEEQGGLENTYAPDCENRDVSVEICPNKDGIYFLTAVHWNESYVPDNSWEVFWKATAYNCDGSVRNMYTGGYNTSMIWDYNDVEWDLAYHENLWDNAKECDACGDAEKCKPKKKKPKPKPKKVDDMYGLTTTTDSNTTKVKPRYGPPAVNTRVTMFDEDGDGWWQDDYMGASYYIADDRRKELFYTGSLCDKHKGYCNLCLGDGAYTARFSGDYSNFTAWDFCGVVGNHAQELSFHVKKGKCIADSIVSLETECFGTIESSVSVIGTLAISGFTSEVFDTSKTSEVTSALLGIVPAWSAHELNVVGTTLDSRALSERALSSFTHDVEFEVSFISELAFSIDGRDSAAVNNLISKLYTDINTKLASGYFIEDTTAELLSLELSGITYFGSEQMIASNLPSLNDNAQSLDVVQYEGDFAVFGVAAIGFVAFVGVIAKSMNKYEALSQDSIHFDDSEVVSAEMDTSLSAVTQNVFGCDSEPTSNARL